MKKTLLSSLLLSLFLISCGGDSANELKKYEGTWNAKLVTVLNGDQDSKTELTTQVKIKAGTNILYIIEQPFKVNGNIIEIPKTTTKNTMNGITMEVAISAKGTLSDKKIDIQEDIHTKSTDADGQVTEMNQTVLIVLTR